MIVLLTDFPKILNERRRSQKLRRRNRRRILKQIANAIQTTKTSNYREHKADHLESRVDGTMTAGSITLVTKTSDITPM